MAHQRTIVGIGEALLVEDPQRTEASGLALQVAREAVRLGHAGVAVSRLGQDRLAEELLARLREIGLRIEHLQSDPDLPTGRVVAPALGGRPRPQPQAAYDNLQWDYDLTDLAHEADIVIYGLHAARSGQTRSVIQQFLGECGTALCVVDLTNRGGDEIERTAAQPLLNAAHLAVTDQAALTALVPGPDQEPPGDAVQRLLRQYELGLVLLVSPGDQALRLTAFDREGSWVMPTGCEPHALVVAVVEFLLGVRSGLGAEESLAAASRAIAYAGEHPGEPIPEEVIRGG